jgi:hypothetical protein
MLLKKVAAKAHNSIQVTDNNNVTRPLKLLSNFVRQAKLDALAVSDPEAGYQYGYTLTFPNNEKYIVSRIIEDYYRNEQIRVNIELLICNNTVTISRQVVQSNNQGGVLGHIETILYTGLACKVVPQAQLQDKLDDVFLGRYVVMIPILNPVEVGDKLQFLHTYNVAKVEGIRNTTEGLLELSFDRDLRW